MVENQLPVIVTGANRGIGLEIVKQLDAQGYRLAACIRSNSGALNEILARSSGRHAKFFIEMDNDSSIRNCAYDVLKWAGVPHALVNCAATATGNLFSMTSINDLRALYQVNLFGPLLFTQYISKKMLRAKEGSIVNIASTAGILADKGTLAYGGSKAALIHATRVLAGELGAFGIRVNAIAPSIVDTEMARQMDVAASTKLNARSAISGTITPEDVASLVNFLISSEASKISGQVIRIDRAMPF